jgi:hypothetical protein
MYAASRNSPWWPLELGYRLARGRKQGTYPIRFEMWIRWHVEFLLNGDGFKAP